MSTDFRELTFKLDSIANFAASDAVNILKSVWIYGVSEDPGECKERDLVTYSHFWINENTQKSRSFHYAFEIKKYRERLELRYHTSFDYVVEQYDIIKQIINKLDCGSEGVTTRLVKD